MTSALRLLVVDDDAAARRPMLLGLRSLGHACDEAAGGPEALAKHRAHPFDVIISDWNMPELTGVELCRRLRVSPGPYVYFILATGHADRSHLLDGMRAGADDFVSKPVDLDELEARLLAGCRVIELQRALLAKNQEARRDSQRFFVAAHRDPLTGLRNRRALDEDLAAIARDRRNPCSGAMIDIDHFKHCNDAFGHRTGDEVLRRVARVVTSQLRKNDAVYRYGGEELFAVLPHQTTEAARTALERVVSAVEELHIAQGPGAARPIITVSAGVAELRGDPEDWIARADTALYRAKRAGRNRVEVE